ncbi:hypothetical protein [Gemmatirosa kalamazoonensis]|uniref:hypothetical protein n=1 Tax=Gemmatirosa kalamazoonensis TaxID=861299 RepID=UPI00130DBFDC|nr:hypothetical protein [Gemmatirosa kalamazoonensis]
MARRASRVKRGPRCLTISRVVRHRRGRREPSSVCARMRPGSAAATRPAMTPP